MYVSMFYPANFKIRKKADAKYLFERVLSKEFPHAFVVFDRVQIVFETDTIGRWQVYQGWIDDDWTQLHLEDANPVEYAWRYRKWINAQWFTEEV